MRTLIRCGPGPTVQVGSAGRADVVWAAAELGVDAAALLVGSVCRQLGALAAAELRGRAGWRTAEVVGASSRRHAVRAAPISVERRNG